MERFPEEYRELRLRTELDLYPQVIEEWAARKYWEEENDEEN